MIAAVFQFPLLSLLLGWRSGLRMAWRKCCESAKFVMRRKRKKRQRPTEAEDVGLGDLLITSWIICVRACQHLVIIDKIIITYFSSGPLINLHVTNRCYTAFYQDLILNLCIFFFVYGGGDRGKERKATQPQVVAILERSPLFSVFFNGWYGSVLNVLALKCPPIFVWLWQNHIFI